MTQTITKHRPLNQSQVKLLTTLYKFRFATAQIICLSQNSRYPRVINSRLRILFDQGYIDRRYDSSYKIRGKPAVYFLAPRGIRYLKTRPFTHSKVINGLYHDKRRSDEHIRHCLNVFETYIALKRQLPDSLKFYAKSELYGRAGMPASLSDALILIDSKDQTQQYFLDCFEQSSSYVHCLIRVKQCVAYGESELWKKLKPLNTLPTMLLVCETKAVQRRMLKLAQKELETTYTDIKFLLTTMDKLQSAQSDDSIWSDVQEPEELLSLDQLG